MRYYLKKSSIQMLFKKLAGRMRLVKKQGSVYLFKLEL